MKRNLFNVSLALFMSCLMLTSCYMTSPSNYLGTMTGANIGGMLGSGIGAATTSGSFGGSLLGNVVGTAAGAALGNNISKRAEQRRQERVQSRRQERSLESQDYDYASDNYDVGEYQTEGGANNSSESYFSISNIYVTDADGDGKMSKEETLELVCDVTNLSSVSTDAVISVGNPGDNKLTFSPNIKATIDSGKSVRYTSKIYCKKLPSGESVEIPITVSSPTHGSVTQNITLYLNR